MAADPLVLLAIVLMAAGTYGSRAAGVWMGGRLRPSRRMEAWLREVPGAVLVSIVAPSVLTGGPADAIAAGVTLAVALRTRNLLAAMAVGVAVVWVARRLLGP